MKSKLPVWLFTIASAKSNYFDVISSFLVCRIPEDADTGKEVNDL